MNKFALIPITIAIGLAQHLAAAQTTNWPNVGNDKGGMRYSPLALINRSNVKNLKVAWAYHTGDSEPGTTIECTPLVIDGVMYVTTCRTKVVALDAATGREKWRFDPYGLGMTSNSIRASGGVNRGVAYWSDGRPGGKRRILLGASDARLISLDTQTGKPDRAFGKGGIVDLRAGLEWDTSRINYGPTSAPAVFENFVILGFSNSEGQPNAPGDVRAFDVRTGEELWRFHTVPRPGEPFHETWLGDSWKERGGANAWGGFTVDEKLGIVYCGTGSCSSDYYGGDRPGNNLFANCTLALDARTGKRLWHFQEVHHDLWDYDNPCPPVMVTVKKDGRHIEAVAQLTKVGMCFLFERKTGKPIYDIQERPVPQSDVPGERSSHTQPFVAKPPPYAPHGFSDDLITNITPEAEAEIREKVRPLRKDGMYTPPSLQGTAVSPGWHGGSTWVGGAFDPTTGILYFNTNNAPTVFKVGKTGRGPIEYNAVALDYLRDSKAYLGSKPPWGLVNAVDLSKGEFAWRSILGEYKELTAQGVPQTGSENFGGVIVTAGGLVFIGGSTDEMFHAFDKTTGKLVWQTKLPAGGYATPCTYSVNGKQYVVIAAGGGGKLPTPSGDEFVAFALPEGTQERSRSRVELVVSDPQFKEPFGVDFGPNNVMYISDMEGNRVFRMETHGKPVVIAGNGEKGYGGDGETSEKSILNGPHSLAVGPGSDLYIADTWNNRVRRIDRSGTISTYAGTGVAGFSGDGGPAAKAQFGGIYCITFDRTKRHMYLADLDNRRIRGIDMRTGIVSTVAGNGSRGVPADGTDAKSSPLVDPRAVAADSKGNVYVLERSGNALRVVDSAGKIRTVVGTSKGGYSGDGGDAREATLSSPKHLCVDAEDNVLIADSDNHAIRKYFPRTGKVITFAGNGKPGNGGVGGPADTLELNQPHGVYVHRSGDIYISDSVNGRVLRIRR